jgi:hypothetical protein
MLRLLGLLVVIVGVAFLTRPSAASMSAVADAKLRGVTEAAAENVDLGGTLGGVVAQAADGAYESFYIAARYRKPAGADPLVECWGLFTQTFCTKVGSPQ